MNWLTTDDAILTVPLEELPQVEPSNFRHDQPLRIDVLTPDVVIPLLVVNRHHNKLTVLNNGAVDLERSQGRPIFQRSSWWQEIHANQIYVCDPRTVGDQALPLPWMQSKPPIWIPTLVSRSIKTISKTLGVNTPGDRTYFGSSAGGFSAIVQLGADRNAQCVVNNAQFDWTRWYPHHVKPVLENYFANRLAADVRKKWPRRTNALTYLTNREVPIKLDYWVNMASDYDRNIQMKIFQDFFSQNPQLVHTINTYQYYEPAQGHNPLPREQTLKILNYSSWRT